MYNTSIVFSELLLHSDVLRWHTSISVAKMNYHSLFLCLLDDLSVALSVCVLVLWVWVLVCVVVGASLPLFPTHFPIFGFSPLVELEKSTFHNKVHRSKQVLGPLFFPFWVFRFPFVFSMSFLLFVPFCTFHFSLIFRVFLCFPFWPSAGPPRPLSAGPPYAFLPSQDRPSAGTPARATFGAAGARTK